MAERGVTLVHTTVMRWVQHYVPVFEKRWKKYARPVSSSWRVDETYIRVKGRWTYLYLYESYTKNWIEDQSDLSTISVATKPLCWGEAC